MMTMVNVVLFIRLETKPGKVSDVNGLLRGCLSLVQEEHSITSWFGIRLGPSTFGIFNGFPNEAGRQEHLSGKLAAALMGRSSDLFTQPPTIEKADVLASNLPQFSKNNYAE